MVTEVGQQFLRAENVDRIIKDLAEQELVMKQVVTVNSSSSWKESFWRETTGDLTAAGTTAIRGVPRLAAFPELVPSWTRQSSFLEKYGGTITISWEDIQTNEIDVLARALHKVARAVANAIDTQIWNVITENQSASNINSVTISAGNEWDAASIANRDPILNILQAIRQITIDNLNVYGQTSYLLVNPTDFANMMSNSKVSQHASWRGAGDIMSNGRVGSILGLQILVSNAVTADFAAVVIGGIAATWKEAAAVTTAQETKPGVSTTITAWSVGVCQLVQPNAVCLISNTAA